MSDIYSVQTYINYVTSEYFNQPNFIATISACVSPMVQIQNVLNSMITLFDLNTPPVGNQLDIIGQWVGISRNVVLSNIVTTLDDSFYLTVIRSKILENSWDGTTEGAYAIWQFLLPTYNILIQDNENMSFDIAIQGVVPDETTLALLEGGYFGFKPEGVQIQWFYIPIDTNPLFGWNMNTPYVQGWGPSSWASVVPGQ